MGLWDRFKAPQGPATVAEAGMLRPNASAFEDVARRNGLELTGYPKNVTEALKVLDVRNQMYLEQHPPPKVQTYLVSGLYQTGSWQTFSPQRLVSYPSTPAGWDDWCDVNGIARFKP